MKGIKNEGYRINLSPNQLPILIVFDGQEGEKEYVLKTNKEHSKLLLNKKEY